MSTRPVSNQGSRCDGTQQLTELDPANSTTRKVRMLAPSSSEARPDDPDLITHRRLSQVCITFAPKVSSVSRQLGLIPPLENKFVVITTIEVDENP